METAGEKPPLLAYSPKKDLIIFIVILAILVGMIFFFDIWYHFCFNITMLGYFIFKELRLATVFFAVLLRIILYPLGRTKKYFDEKLIKAKKELKENVQAISRPLERDQAKRQWLLTYRGIISFDWFYFCFYSMNALVVASMFLQPFTGQRVAEQVFFKFLLPAFPLRTTDWIPLVGMVDLTKINLTLNLITAIGAGMVGLLEVALNQKTEKKELLMYLVFFPVGAYFITMFVPAGFEFSLAIFELLTIIIILLEKFLESGIFKFFFVRPVKRG